MCKNNDNRIEDRMIDRTSENVNVERKKEG